MDWDDNVDSPRRHFLETTGSAILIASLSVIAAGTRVLGSCLEALEPEQPPLPLDWFEDAFPSARPGSREALAVVAKECRLYRPRRLTYFLAQCAHETRGFSLLHEIASGNAYEGRSSLGNTHKGDGRRYRGRGWLMLTGRYNYQRYEYATGRPVLDHPEMIEDDVALAAHTAGWYWRLIGGNLYADRSDFRGLTRAINGGYNGLDDRRRWLRRIESIAHL